MAKVYKFKDKKEIEFTDNSTLTNLVTIVKNFADLDAIKAEFTESNVNGGTFDGQTVRNVVPLTMTATANVGDNIVGTFTMRIKSQEEINTENIDAINAALDDLAAAVAGGTNNG